MLSNLKCGVGWQVKGMESIMSGFTQTVGQPAGKLGIDEEVHAPTGFCKVITGRR